MMTNIKVYFDPLSFEDYMNGEDAKAYLKRYDAYSQMYDIEIEVPLDSVTVVHEYQVRVKKKSELSTYLEDVSIGEGLNSEQTVNIHVNEVVTLCGNVGEEFTNRLVKEIMDGLNKIRETPSNEKPDEDQRKPISIYFTKEEYKKYIKNEEAVARFFRDTLEDIKVKLIPEDFSLVHYRGIEVTDIEGFEFDTVNSVVIKPKRRQLT